MPRFRSSLLVLLLLVAGSLAYGGLPLNNPEVRHIGNLLRCQCGCPYSVSDCDMTDCPFAEPARVQIQKYLADGKTEQQVLNLFVAKYGEQILLRPPATGFFLVGWLMPFAGLLAGLGVIWLLLKRYLRPPAAVATPEAESTPELDRYRAEIEKTLENLE